ncbi:MAG TPA: MlaD family protein [Solirubrobacteraceae bacterium]|jgi:phospholipid/cholesterol/gamma-HCH transport system substrate-binding protein|nr:MlaD family protein [Solirubrobacteraceae bacterium]
MATTSPPSPPPAAPPPGERTPPVGSVRSPSRTGRWLALGGLVAVLAALGFIVLGGKGGADYQLVFPEAGQLVKGDQVQVGGVPAGTITNIVLTKDFKARVTIHVEGSLVPLHEGTVTQVRIPSLSSVANRFIALTPGPNNRPAIPAGSTLPTGATKEVVDLDKLFNTLDPKTRKGLQGFIQGSAEQYVGAGRALGVSTEYFPPSLAAANHFFAELVRDQPVFTRFLVETSKAVTTIGARKEDLAGLIEHANTTFQAIGSEQTALAQGLHELPVTLKQGNVTFANLPSTFAALTHLVEVSKPTSKPLTTLFSRLRPLVTTATPAVRNFNLAINRPGPTNDLTDLAHALPGLAKELSTSSPATVRSLKESVPITFFFGPYSPDLEGTLRTFGQGGSYYDANGHYARVTPILPEFRLGENNTLTPTSSQQALENLKTGQVRRCPGGATQPAADKSSPFANEMLTCDPLQTP